MWLQKLLRAATSGHLVLSTIHSNNVSDAINALVKYAASSGISEDMAYELVANGFLGCIHQILEGAPKRAKVSYLFANPDTNAACQVRGMLRSGKLNMGTLLEQQRVKNRKRFVLVLDITKAENIKTPLYFVMGKYFVYRILSDKYRENRHCGRRRKPYPC